MEQIKDFNKQNQTLIKCAIAIIIITIMGIIIYLWKVKYDQAEAFLFGSWDSDVAFNQTAGIKSMKLFIGEKIDNIRDCYLHIDDIVSQVIKITFSSFLPTVFLNTFKNTKNHILYNVHFDFKSDSDSPTEIFKEDLILDLDIINGWIRLYDLKTDNSVGELYASLYKDSASTHFLLLQNQNPIEKSVESEDEESE